MSDIKLVPAVITVTPITPINGLYYIGQYGTSGYASAAKGYLYHYFTNGIPLTWEPLYYDNSTLSDDDVYDIIVKSLINKPLSEYDMVIMHCTPDLWPKFWQEKSKILTNKIVNGYCTWETDRLPTEWVKCINGYVNEVWCPSKYNEQAFKNSGVTAPIRIVPHIFLTQPLPDPSIVKIVNTANGDRIEKDGRFTFYAIAEMNIRKGIEDTIKAFCEAFRKKDPVRLILKVHYRNYAMENKRKCEEMINEVLKYYPNHPPIVCLLENMRNKEMLALHSIGDCYISLTKSEGFGLTIFDAYNYNKKIICTGYGGHIDFLGNKYPGLVRYKIGPVTGMTSFSSNYTEEQSWAYPDIDHAIELMRKQINL
jgi:glycosyltransferase involved in cell wall biosynthesis